MRILVTAFDPFGGEDVNPALEAVKLLPDTIARAEVVKLEVPTVFGKSLKVLKANIDDVRPDLVLGVGQAGGRYDITVERVAINVNDARIADNEDNQPIDTPIFEDGLNAYFATLPIKRMVEAVHDVDLPASVSNTAGTFVCNHLMYGILYFVAKAYPEARGGFVHVPFIPEQVVEKRMQPSMALSDIARGLEAAIAAAVEHREDVTVTGGTLH